MSRQKKESEILNVGQWKLLRLNNRKKKRFKKSEQSLRDLWDTIKWTNIHIMRVQKKERKGQREYLHSG